MALIGLGEYCRRIIHYIFAKKIKAEGRMIDALWETAGSGMDTARDNIVAGARMMHPAWSEGAYADRHADSLGHLQRLPGEADVDFQTRIGAAFDFWRSAGTTPFFLSYGPLLNCPVTVARHPTRAFSRLITLFGIPTDQMRLFLDFYKFRSAHHIFEYQLDPGIRYKRLTGSWNLDGLSRINIIEASS